MPLPALNTPPTTDQILAVIEVVVLIAYADGSLAATEEAEIIRGISEISGGSADAAWVTDSVRIVRPPLPPTPDWRAARLLALTAILATDELREAAFALALEVAHVDGGIGLREVSLLAATAEELGLNSQVALTYLDRAEKR